MVLGDSCPSRDAPGLRKNLWTRPGAASGDCRAVDQKLRDRTSTKASPQQTACRVASSEVFPITVVIFLRQSFVDRDLKKVGCAGCPSSPWETLVVAFPHVLGPVPGRVGLRQPRLSLWGATDLLRSCEGFRLEASWRQHGQHAPPHSARHRTTSFPPPPPATLPAPPSLGCREEGAWSQETLPRPVRSRSPTQIQKVLRPSVRWIVVPPGRGRDPPSLLVVGALLQALPLEGSFVFLVRATLSVLLATCCDLLFGNPRWCSRILSRCVDGGKWASSNASLLSASFAAPPVPVESGAAGRATSSSTYFCADVSELSELFIR